MQGIIVIWSGAIVDIPAGWALCDGNNGTPNLTNRFIRGAGDTYNPGDTGGDVAHTHVFTGDGHSHVIPAGTSLNAGVNRSVTTEDGEGVGITNSTFHLPPYYALAFIMKL